MTHAHHAQWIKSNDQDAKVFRKACELAGIPATTRQASKWQRQFGAAWTYKQQAVEAMNPTAE